jgi:hypothetical protein
MLTLYTVVDLKTDNTMGKYVKKTSAMKRADSLNIMYGAHRYGVYEETEVLIEGVKSRKKGLTF